MSRRAFLEQITARHAREAFQVLVTLSGGGLAAPVYIVSGFEDITSRGNVFLASDVQAVFPSTGSDNGSAAQLILEGVSAELVDHVGTLTGKCKVLFELVMSDDPDSVETQTAPMDLVNVRVKNMRITGTIVSPDDSGEPVMGISIGPHNAPGAFAS